MSNGSIKSGIRTIQHKQNHYNVAHKQFHFRIYAQTISQYALVSTDVETANVRQDHQGLQTAMKATYFN